MTSGTLTFTRRTFLRYAGTAAVGTACRNGVFTGFCPSPLTIAFIGGGPRSHLVLHALLRSDSFDVASVCLKGSGLSQVRAMCTRYGRRVPYVLSDSREAVECADIKAIILSGESADLASVLTTTPVIGKAVFFDHPPLVAETFISDPRLQQRSHFVHVGMLSAHDVSVSEMEATIRSGAIGSVTGVNALGDDGEPWKQLELVNIARCAIRASVHDNTEQLDLADIRRYQIQTIPSVNQQLWRPEVQVLGTCGKLRIPGYSKRDRVEAIPVMLEVFRHAAHNPGDLSRTLSHAIASWGLRSKLNFGHVTN